MIAITACDGSAVVVRAIRPDDRELLLSAEDGRRQRRSAPAGG